jgi:hypothetical protein
MKIKTHYYLPQDEHLDFKLVLGANSIWPRGRIAYGRFLHNQMVSGVQFVALSELDRALLQKCLASLEEKPEPRNTLSKPDGRESVEQ